MLALMEADDDGVIELDLLALSDEERDGDEENEEDGEMLGDTDVE